MEMLIEAATERRLGWRLDSVKQKKRGRPKEMMNHPANAIAGKVAAMWMPLMLSVMIA